MMVRYGVAPLEGRVVDWAKKYDPEVECRGKQSSQTKAFRSTELDEERQAARKDPGPCFAVEAVVVARPIRRAPLDLRSRIRPASWPSDRTSEHASLQQVRCSNHNQWARLDSNQRPTDYAVSYTHLTLPTNREV